MLNVGKGLFTNRPETVLTVFDCHMQQTASGLVSHVDIDMMFHQSFGNALLTRVQCKVQWQVAFAVKFVQLSRQLHQDNTQTHQHIHT